MRTSPAGVTIIKKFEGCRLVAYQDKAGVWTIGYGHIRGATAGMTCSQDQAEQWLLDDIANAETGMACVLSAIVNQNQWDALASFTFNVGIGSLKTSHLLEALNDGNFRGAANEFMCWLFVAGEPCDDLYGRRKLERQLFLQPI